MAKVAQRGEFDTLVRPVLPIAYRYAVRLTRNPDDAMDLVQSSAVNAFRAFEQFQSGTNFRAWFLRIVTNQHYRNRRRVAVTVSLDDAPDLFLYEHAKRQGLPMDGDPAGPIFERVTQDEVTEALARLPEEYRVVATLYFTGEMTYEELAEALELPVGTIRSRLHRARKSLQVQLWRVAEERGLVATENA